MFICSGNRILKYKVRVTNANTYTKADSTRLSPKFVNIGLAHNDLCDFYCTNIGMKFFSNIILKKLFIFLKHASVHLLLFIRNVLRKQIVS